MRKKGLVASLTILLLGLLLPIPALPHEAHGDENHHEEMHNEHHPIVTVTIRNETGFNVSLTFVTSLCPRVILGPGESQKVVGCFRENLLYHTAIVWYTDEEVVEERTARDDLAIFQARPNAEWVLLSTTGEEEKK